MYIRIDSSSGVPIWQQVVTQVTRQAISGAVSAGDQLPTVRDLASELRVNPNTIAKAYQELERNGIVETKRGLGTFIIEYTKIHGIEGIESLNDRIDAAIVEATQLRVDASSFLAIVEDRLTKFSMKPSQMPAPKEIKK
jgi:GntR family transcriptional regulator